MEMDRPTTAGKVTVAKMQDRGRVEIFDPPMCCPTGLCGPTIDKALLDVNEMVLALKGLLPHEVKGLAMLAQLGEQVYGNGGCCG